MISRRSIRIKLMQGFYTYEKSSDLTEDKLLYICMQSINRFNALMLFNLYIVENTCAYVKDYTDSLRTLKTRKISDIELSLRVFENNIIRFIQNSSNYHTTCKTEHFDKKFDSDLFRKYFLELKNTDSYNKYLLSNPADLKEDYYIFNELYSHIILADKDFDGIMEDIYPEWADDKHHIKSIVLDIFKQLGNGTQPNLKESIDNRDKSFVESMINSYVYHHTAINEHISKRLKNWDEERVAELDMIIIRQGVCEFLYQPEIPVKVSINEYLEIAKQYSTPKSSEFINGILDGILKDLRDQNLVKKTGKGLVES